MSGKKTDRTTELEAEIAVLNRQIKILVQNIVSNVECDVCSATLKCGKSGLVCQETLISFSRKQAEEGMATPKPVLNRLSANYFNLSAEENGKAFEGVKGDNGSKLTPKSFSAKDFNKLPVRDKWKMWRDQKGIWKCKYCKAIMEDGPRSPGPFEGGAIVCGECDFEPTRRTPGGQSNPFEWDLSDLYRC